MEHYPQKLVNVPIGIRKRIEEIPEIVRLQGQLEKQLGTEGRMLIRPSGTEPVIRVMVEGASREMIESVADEMASCIRKHLTA